MSTIENNTNIMGGISVFSGTRVPINALFDYLLAGDTITDFLSDFPTVSFAQVKHILQRIEVSVKNIEQQIIEDNNYVMKDKYDFSDGIRGRFYEPKKIPISMRLHNDILIFLKKQAGEKR